MPFDLIDHRLGRPVRLRIRPSRARAHPDTPRNRQRPHAFWFPVCVSLIEACKHSTPDSSESAAALPVQVVQAVSRRVVEWAKSLGRVETLQSVDIRARVDGYLHRVNFKAGDEVSQGDLLFVIDPRPFKAQLDYAHAELEQARARVELAKNNLARAELLVKATACSQEEYETRKSEVRVAAAAVQSAAANVASARLKLDFTQIKAPISGRIGRELISVGNLVKGGADATGHLPKRPGVPSDAVPPELALVDQSDFPYRGNIDYQSPRLDLASGTLTLRGVFRNPQGLLSPGLFARKRVPAAAAFQAILVPDRAIVTDLVQKFVWVVNGANQVDRRSVTPGSLIDGLRVVSSGLEAGAWVVVAGLQRLRSGVTVDPKPFSAAGSSPG